MDGRKRNKMFLFVLAGLAGLMLLSMVINTPNKSSDSGLSEMPEPVSLANLDEFLAEENIDKVAIDQRNNVLFIYILYESIQIDETEETKEPVESAQPVILVRIEKLAYTEGYEGDLTKNLIISSRENDFQLEIRSVETGILDVLMAFLPLIIIFGFLFWWIRRSQKNAAGAGGVGGAAFKIPTRAKRVMLPPSVKFADVAGMDEAVEDMQEIKDFLKFPEKFKMLGARTPRGVLLTGPPGTGKTLLARATAGEAEVPFFTISGSEFVELYVGVGASRVRDFFAEAKKNSPSVVFIDEIDAVGRQRGSGVGGSNDEREQTLNQILTEMDGFDTNTGILVIAATNRPDILDPALLRPGRFDRKIVIDRPDVLGREKILAVHAKGKPFEYDVDFSLVARQTAGFTGADLENLLNEAALLAVHRDKKQIGRKEVEDSFDKLIAGSERKTRVMTEATKRVIAYHETGHALVGYALKHANPVQKITIISRGMSLGHTQSLPAEDQFLHTRNQLLDHIAMSLGGNAAEELVFGEPTTGASNDIQKATEIARSMVENYGMSAKLGRVGYGSQGQMFLGRDFTQSKKYSEAVAALIDEEVRLISERAYQEARQIIEANRPAMDRMAEALLERETVSGQDIDEMFEGVLKDGWIRTEEGVRPKTD